MITYYLHFDRRKTLYLGKLLPRYLRYVEEFHGRESVVLADYESLEEDCIEISED